MALARARADDQHLQSDRLHQRPDELRRRESPDGMVEIHRGHDIQADTLQQFESLFERAKVAGMMIGVNHAAGLLAERDRH